MARADDDVTDGGDLDAPATDDSIASLLAKVTPASPEIAPGTIVDGAYRIESRLGSGGMGIVYRAKDVALDRDVALKIHRAQEGLDRLQREAVAMARLDHPNVVRVHAAGEVDGRVYVAMEHVPGGTLRGWCAEPHSWREKVAMISEAARGLAAAHAAGFVHRDFKPENVLIDRHGKPKVSDFGLVAVAGESSGEVAADAPVLEITLTGTGVAVGTPAYMAPEQLDGKPVDARADQFALGVVLHEALAGSRPFKGDTWAPLRDAVAQGRKDPLPRGAAPRRIARAIDRALSVDPAARFATVDAMLAALAPRRRAWWILAVPVILAIGAFALWPRDTPRTHAGAHPTGARSCGRESWCWDTDWPGVTLLGGWRRAPDDAWAVGTLGTARHWNGKKWSRLDTSIAAHLLAAHGTAADDVWIVGDQGVILHWDGNALSSIPSPVKTALNGVLALARDDAWAVGVKGVILHWDGQAWREMPSGTTIDLGVITANGPHDLWIGGASGVVLHGDGATFTTTDASTTALLTGISAAAPDDVWLVGFEGTIRHWDGKQWNAVPVPEIAGSPHAFFNNVRALGPDDVWFVTKRGPLLHLDHGAWRAFPPPTQRELFQITGTANDLDVYGADLTTLHWDGASWTLAAPEPTVFQPYALHVVASDDVWATGGISRERGALERFDGTRWQLLDVGDLPFLRAIGGVGDDVWVAGEGGAVAHWDGAHFARVTSGSDVVLRGVAPIAGGGVWVVGEAGTILRCSDACAPVASGVTDDLIAIASSGADEAWAVGDHGTVLHEQGGAWSPIASGTDRMLLSIWIDRADDVWIGGAYGTVLRGGAAGFTVGSTGTEFLHLSGIWGTGPDDVWATCNSFGGVGQLAHWNGQFWTALDQTRAALDAIRGAAPDDVWAVGPGDLKLHYEPR